uniref:Uncharacterized protein n=1 Tax=Amorphochlora amoebiformis TaxID=1561963 RepID=A0A7S0H446_9EUKA|mmetsp:Transcript_8889/g.13991  ORF Transcript_8889/g.13991 Transcript_8889/m.13991 type:complete len:229 (+) Transcript_8889:75-761(+)
MTAEIVAGAGAGAGGAGAGVESMGSGGSVSSSIGTSTHLAPIRVTASSAPMRSRHGGANIQSTSHKGLSEKGSGVSERRTAQGSLPVVRGFSKSSKTEAKGPGNPENTATVTTSGTVTATAATSAAAPTTSAAGALLPPYSSPSIQAMAIGMSGMSPMTNMTNINDDKDSQIPFPSPINLPLTGNPTAVPQLSSEDAQISIGEMPNHHRIPGDLLGLTDPSRALSSDI